MCNAFSWSNNLHIVTCLISYISADTRELAIVVGIFIEIIMLGTHNFILRSLWMKTFYYAIDANYDDYDR